MSLVEDIKYRSYANAESLDRDIEIAKSESLDRMADALERISSALDHMAAEIPFPEDKNDRQF